MKRTLIATLLATTASVSFANSPFDFQKQFGSEEYVHGYDAADLVFAPVIASDFTPSLDETMLSANVDSIAPNEFVGEIVESGPTRISLYEVHRDSPEGIAYSGYHERFPADTNWNALRSDRMASSADADNGDS